MHATKKALIFRVITGWLGSLPTLSGWFWSGLGHGENVRVGSGCNILFQAGSGRVSTAAKILGLVRVGFGSYVISRVNKGRAFCY